MKRAAILLTLLPIAACASAQAKTPAVEKPALEVPPVPPRAVEPPLPPPPEPVSPLPDEKPTAEKPNSGRTAKPAPNREQTREPAKPPESKPDPTPPAEATTPAPAVPPLRAQETPAASDLAARAVREIVDRGRKTLDGVDYRNLKAELRKEYDNAKQFFQQAEDALKASNYELGRSLADKGERIAKQLQGR